MAWLYFPEADKDLSRTVTKPHKPTPKLIQAYVARVQNDVRYQVADGALTKLFELFPQNNNLDEVLVKVTTLNTLYSTNIFGVFDVAQHIVGLKIDTSLNQGLLDVVPKIANVKIGGVHRTVYSFATKYCHWHKPDLYPIYDSYVEKVLWAYQRVGAFSK